MNTPPLERRRRNQMNTMLVTRAIAMQLVTGTVRAVEYMSGRGVDPNLICRVLNGSALRADDMGQRRRNAAHGASLMPEQSS